MPRSLLRHFPAAALAAVSSLGAAADTAAAQAPAGPQVVHSNRETFRIPFAASAADLAAAGATEARLLVSTDGGRQWHEGGRAEPGSGGFRYAAPADGDYWFSVLTVDAAGQPAPAEVAIVPQLHVRMDRVAPAVTLAAAPAGDGTVAVSWAVNDAAANPATLTATFTPDGGAPQAVPVAKGLNGSFRIPAARSAGTVTVSATDAAGNVGTASGRTDGAPTDDARTTPSATPPANRQATPAQYAVPADPHAPSAHGSAFYTPVPSRSRTAALPTYPEPALPQTGSVTPLPAPPPPALPGDGTFGDALDYGPMQPVARQTPPAPTPAPLRATGTVLKNRSFKIGYAVDAVGSSGVGKVELFITPDGGRHWYSYGEDADRQSPANVTVPGDGEYGFCVRVRSGAGLSDAPPKAGDAPDVRITVDGTPPAVEILSAGQGRGADANTLSLAWRITDDRPAAAPVRVELGESPAGPWELVRDWHVDAGAAAVPIRPGQGARSGGRVYVRVTARDEAGNERSAVTPNGVPVDLSRPSARILGVVR